MVSRSIRIAPVRGSRLQPRRAARRCTRILRSAGSEPVESWSRSRPPLEPSARQRSSLRPQQGSTDLRALRRHLRPVDSYAVVTEPLPAAVRRETGKRTSALRDVDVPPHQLRWLKDDRALFAGADQPAVDDRARSKALVQRTGQLMYELSVLYPAISGLQPEWSWGSTHYETVDRLPFIGLHRNFPRHLFAMGAAQHGASLAWLAARILLRQYQGDPAKGDDLFGFSRVL